MAKPKVLVILQNAFGEGQRTEPIYRADTCYRKNATYSRILPYVEDISDLYLTECTRIIANNPRDKFPTDLKHMYSVVHCTDWDLIVSCGKQAEDALSSIKFKSDKLRILPHPVSFKWRRKMIEDIANEIKQIQTT